MDIKFEGDEIIYPVVEERRLSMPPAWQELLADFAREGTGNKIKAIKFLRAEYSLYLKDAKDIVEALISKYPEQASITNLGKLLRDKLDRDEIAALS